MYYRLLMRTKDGVRVSSRLSSIDASIASCIYKNQFGGALVEIIPDAASLRAQYGELDRRAATGGANLQKLGIEGSGCAVVWDRRFCIRTAAAESSQPGERIYPTKAHLLPPSVSPERAQEAWIRPVGCAIGFTLFLSMHPCLAAAWLARAFWTWLVGPELRKGARSW